LLPLTIFWEKNSSTKMIDLLHAAPCGIFSFDDEGILLQANPTFCELLKADIRELTGKKLDQVLTLSSLIFYQTHFYPLLKMQRSAEEIFLTLKTKAGGEVPVLLSARRIENEGIIENVCSCQAVYNRRNYEAELIAARKKAEKALQENAELADTRAGLQKHIHLLDEQMYLLHQRNEELTELTNSISHDLQEPLRKLIFYTDLLRLPQPPLNREDTLEKVMRLAQRSKDLLLGLQQYTSLDSAASPQTEVDLNQVLGTARQQVRELYPSLEMRVTAANLPTIYANGEQFLTLFFQLLSNSVKFRSAERPLEIQVEHTLLKTNAFKSLPDHFHYTEHHRITYSDNGKGFPRKYRDQIFRMFRKLDPSTEGLGIGLALVRKVVAHHNGSVTATSQEGAGSTFTILLPAG
jgi:phosphoserine phosphatase RsbU/P